MNPNNKTGMATFCNGAGALATCWNFTNEFAEAWNTGHVEVLNESQTFLAGLPQSGPTINGVWARYSKDPCDFDTMKDVAADPDYAVMEASRGGCLSGVSHDKAISCMASFLSHVRHGMYVRTYHGTGTLRVHCAVDVRLPWTTTTTTTTTTKR